MRKYIIIGLLFIFLFTCLLKAQNGSSPEQVGTSMANFLKIGVGARALAMGDAYVALADDITSLYWNPGCLDRIPKNEMVTQYIDWILDSQIYFIGIGYKVPTIGTFGVSVHYFSSGEMEETTLQEPEGTGRTFTASDMSLGLTYSKQITDRFSTGITVKYIQETLSRESASTFAFDIGNIFETNFFNNMRIGMSLSNLGGTMRLQGVELERQYSTNPDFPTKVTRANLKTQDWNIPLFFRLGVATNVIENEQYRITVSSEVMDSRDYIHRISVGSEIAFWEKTFLRVGYKFNNDERNITLGGGVNLPMGSSNLKINYGYGNFGVFNNTQRFSLIYAF